MKANGKEVVAYHWLDDTTMMVLTEDMEWFRLEGVYLSGVSFGELDCSPCESVTLVGATTRYQPAAESPEASRSS